MIAGCSDQDGLVQRAQRTGKMNKGKKLTCTVQESHEGEGKVAGEWNPPEIILNNF